MISWEQFRDILEILEIIKTKILKYANKDVGILQIVHLNEAPSEATLVELTFELIHKSISLSAKFVYGLHEVTNFH